MNQKRKKMLVMLVYQTLVKKSKRITYIHQVARKTLELNTHVALFLLDV